MALPKSVTKVGKNGVTFTSNVDLTIYTLEELKRAALRDAGKFCTREARKLAPKRTGKGRKAIQYWNRKGDEGLQIGIKKEGFYMGFFELGTEGLPKIGMITNAVEQNIDIIRQIQAQYLSAIQDAILAESLIDEDEEVGDDED